VAVRGWSNTQVSVLDQTEGAQISVLCKQVLRQAFQLIMPEVDLRGADEAVKYAGRQLLQLVPIQAEMGEVPLVQEHGGRQPIELVAVEAEPLQAGQRLQEAVLQRGEAAVHEHELAETAQVLEGVRVEFELLVAGQIEAGEVGRTLEEGFIHVCDVVVLKHWKNKGLS